MNDLLRYDTAGNPVLKAKPGVTVAENNRVPAAARDKQLEPVLRELQHLSPQKSADEIERRGLGKMSQKTVKRARSSRAGAVMTPAPLAAVAEPV